MFSVACSYYFDMDFTLIFIGVLAFAQICFGQTSNGQSFNIKPKQNVPVASNSYNKTDTPVYGNFKNSAANHFNQKKLSILQSANRISELANQPSKPVLENRQNIFPSFPQQLTLQQLLNVPQLQSNIQQKNHIETPAQPNLSLGSFNLLQNQNANTIQALPEPLPNSNILPAPNIIPAEYKQPLQNNNFVIPAIPNTPTISPSLTVTTSLNPSMIPTSKTPKVYVQKLPNIQESSFVSPKKVFVALREAPISQPMIPTYLPHADNSEKSLNLKRILPLILNLMTEKESTSCSRCSCCCNSDNNVNEAPKIDTGYSRLRKYGPSSEELEDDASEELTRKLVRRIKNKIYKAKRRLRFQKNNVLSDEDFDESQSDEDYYFS